MWYHNNNTGVVDNRRSLPSCGHCLLLRSWRSHLNTPDQPPLVKAAAEAHWLVGQDLQPHCCAHGSHVKFNKRRSSGVPRMATSTLPRKPSGTSTRALLPHGCCPAWCFPTTTCVSQPITHNSSPQLPSTWRASTVITGCSDRGASLGQQLSSSLHTSQVVQRRQDLQSIPALKTTHVLLRINVHREVLLLEMELC